MSLKLIEVDGDHKDMYEDILRIGTILLTAFVMHMFVLKTPDVGSWTQLAQTIMITFTGIAAFHLIVDKSVVRFVPKKGQEAFYSSLKRN